ncbi:Ger(x)C family spore germination protein [Heliobacterium chlorum]|uniref:Ger(X)C family spore germination protein n=1 Tax=Heliobacterium chlorum TaxID=2698 RepID=A0ABR7T5R6_HELCL|nr:Ger(x)C family spore germination protein [Heliobacterium chlorum]MBC9785715.1 Ger(x)C family spore germination protein [Heliobacterium chlorum]
MRSWLKWICVCIVFATLALQTGCWDRNELENLAFVLTMGVDRSIDNKIDVVMRIAVPGNIGGPTGKTGGESITQTTKPITITARTIPEAVSLAEATVERRVDFRHLRVLIFGEEIAKEGVLPYLDVLERFPQFRRSVYIWVAKEGPARNIFLTAEPVLEKSVSRYVDDVARGVVRYGYTRMPTLHDFLNEVDNHQLNAVLPLVGVNPIVSSEKKDGSVRPLPTDKYHQEIEGNVEPGGKTLRSLPRSGGNPSEFLGIAVMQEGRLIDKWSAWDARIYGLLRDSYRGGIWVFDTPNGKGPFSVIIRRAQQPKIDVTWEGDKPFIDIHLFLEGQLLSVLALEPYVSTDRITLLESQVVDSITAETSQLIERAQKEKIDPFYLARSIQMRSLTMQEFDSLDWKNRFSGASVTVHVDFKIRRPGLRIQPRSEESR